MTNKKKIDKLTPAQEMQLPKYRDLGIELGIRVDPTGNLDEKLVRELTDAHRRMHGFATATNFLIYDSPFAAIQDVNTKLGSRVLHQGNALYGQHDSNWLITYLYYRVELGLVEETEQIKHLIELCKHVGWMWMSSDTTVVTKIPARLSTRLNTRTGLRILHDYNKLALEYFDGTGVYVFNGLRIPREYEKFVLTPPEKLNLAKILEIENTSIRTEVVKKFLSAGENIKLEETEGVSLLDQAEVGGSKYKLFKLECIEPARVYLASSCPSSGKPFLECVPPEINTCELALGWREYQVLTRDDIRAVASGKRKFVYKAPEVRT